MTRDAAGITTTRQLTCSPTGGDLPDPAQACKVLAEEGPSALPAVPANRACTSIYGGPETARIVGTWRGQALDASVKRINGCEIARWAALTGLLPAPG